MDKKYTAHKFSPMNHAEPDLILEIKRKSKNIMSDKENGYCIMSCAIASYLTPFEHKVIFYIQRYSSRLGGMRVSLSRLSEITQIGINTVGYCVDDLCDIGLVRVISANESIKTYAIDLENVEKLIRICSDWCLSDYGIVQLRKKLKFKNIGKLTKAEIEKAAKGCEIDEFKLNRQNDAYEQQD
jgi:hypothetical protein